MSVYKRTWKQKDGSTAFCWYFHRTIDGVRYRDRIPTARTKREADEAERKILAQIHEGTYGKPKGNTTLREFVEGTFIPWSKENKKSWRSDLSRLKPILAYFGKKRLREICENPFLVETFKSKRLKAPVVYKTKNGQGKQKNRSKAAVNRELQLLSRIFTLAMSRKEVSTNPVSQVELFKGEKRRKRRLGPDERLRLFEAIPGKLSQARRSHLIPIVLLALNCGLRRTELLSLKTEDIDFEQNIINVRDTKNGEDREVEMNATAKGVCLDLVAQARAKGWIYIFTNPKTGIRYKDIKKGFGNALRDAGIEDFRFHDLRHTFASTAGDDPRVPITALAETLGHKDWRTTMQYTHASKSGKLRVVEAQERTEDERAGHKMVTKNERQAV